MAKHQSYGTVCVCAMAICYSPTNSRARFFVLCSLFDKRDPYILVYQVAILFDRGSLGLVCPVLVSVKTSNVENNKKTK